MKPSPYRAVITTTDKCPRCTAREPDGRPSFLGHEVVAHPHLTTILVFCYSSRCGYLDVLTASTPDHRSSLDLLSKWRRSRWVIAGLVLLLMAAFLWATLATIYLLRG